MPPIVPDAPEVSALRRKLLQRGGRASWQALAMEAESPEFQRFVRARHPSLEPMLAGPGRRRLLQVMAASFALAGLSSTGRAANSGTSEIVPYVNQPTSLVPTKPLYYASAALLDGIANGVLVTTIDGRPIKIEGNPQHPWSRGGTDPFMQAFILDLYDPDRSQSVLHLSDPSDWDSFQGAMLGRFAAFRAAQGSGLRILTGPLSSPSLIAQLQAMQKAMPEMHWHVHAPVGRDAAYAGAKLAFGKPLETQWDFDQAQLIVSLDGDFLDAGPQQVGAAGRWVAARQKAAREGRLLTMHAVAPAPTLTYAKADDHLPVAQSELLPLAEALLAEVSSGPQGGSGPLAEWRGRVATALKAARGTSIVVAGTQQTPELQALVHRINAALGNAGKTVLYTEPVLAQPEPLQDLVQAMQRGQVAALVMLDTNPVYSAPADAEFAAALAKVPLKLHAATHVDETALLADWHLPLSHPLEAWGDARSLDGTVTLMQPTVERLYDTRSVPELLSLLTEAQPRAGAAILHAHWQANSPGGNFESAWREALLQGFIGSSALPVQPVTATAAAAGAKPSAAPAAIHATNQPAPEVILRPDPTIWDGRYANNAWLQELPKPLSKIVWENVIALSPRLAAQHGLKSGDSTVVQVGKQWIAGPAWIVPGQHDTTVVLYLGYGRQQAGSVGEHLGYSAYPIRRFDALWQLGEGTIRRGHGAATIASSQQLDDQEGHDYVRLQPLGGKPVGDQTADTQPTLYNRDPTDGRAWGMVIDLDSCIGCNACVVACQAENNVPVVGKPEFLAGRDMHWLRVDRYDTGGEANPATRFMPVPCMQCETAPCELGCPVEATVHDHEGLNLMVYNRCVGTRACSAYCPYKVRHFNYLHYSDAPPSIQARRNPEVTVRARGVMEKCTYCVQRIVTARIDADREHRPIADGEVVTACAAACPTRAIHFGDLADTGSDVAAARRDPRNYALLGELNTRPRTTYLAALAPADRKA